MIASALNVILLVACAGALYGWGAALSRVFIERRFRFWALSARLAFALALGLGAVVILLFGLGLLGWLTPAAGWSLLALGWLLIPANLALLHESLHALRSRLRQLRHVDNKWLWALAILLVVQTGLTLIADLAPPVEGDTINQYLLAARYWALDGRYWQPPQIWGATLPGHMLMLSTWGLLLRGTGEATIYSAYAFATLLSGLLMSLYLWLSIYALARVRYSATVGFIAATLIYLMPDAIYLAESGKVDMGWAFYETLTLAAIFHWSQRDDARHRWLALAGVCFGMAIGAKSQALLSAPYLGGWVAIVSWRRGGATRVAQALLTIGGLALIIGLPYLVYNAVAHHNPFYPVFASQFEQWLGGTHSPRSELGTEVFYEWTVGGYLLNLWDASLGHPPPFYLGFWAGPAYLMLLPVGALLRKYDRWTNAFVLYAFLFSIAWFVVKQAVRHFLPGLILLAVVVAYILHRLEEEPRWLRHLIYLPLTLSLALATAFWAGIIAGNGAYRPALGLQTPQEYVWHWTDTVVTTEDFPDGDILDFAHDELSPDARILTMHTPYSLYFAQDMVSFNWGDRFNIASLDNEDALLDYLVAHNIEYLLIYKSDLANADLPLFSQPEFYETRATLVVETRRTLLYRLTGE